MCVGNTVPFDVSLHRMTPDRVAYIMRTHTVKIDSIRTYYTRERVEATTTSCEIHEVVSSFLLYILGTTLFTDIMSSIN